MFSNMFVTLVESIIRNLSMFSEVISLHPPNIKLIFVTFAVLKCDKSNAVNELHRWNIPLIFVTCEESKCDKSKVVKELNPINIKWQSGDNMILSAAVNILIWSSFFVP